MSETDSSDPVFRLSVSDYVARIEEMAPHADGDRTWQVQHVMSALKAKGVSYGIDIDEIQRVCNEVNDTGQIVRNVVIAKGEAPINPGLLWKPIIEPGGMVLSGEVVWRGEPVDEGQTGTNLQGKLVSYGAAPELELGENCFIGMNDNEVQATVYGILIDGEKPAVEPLVWISEDKMEAFADIHPYSAQGKELTEEDLLRALKSARVTYGILIDDRVDTAMRRARDLGKPEPNLLLARGKRPRSGCAAAKFTFMLDGRDPIDVARDVDSGKLDPAKVIQPMARGGQRLASSTPASNPRMGIDLFGEDVPYASGMQAVFLASGTNVEQDSDSNEFRTTIPHWGYVNLTRKDETHWELNVEPPLQVSEDKTSLDLRVYPPRAGQPQVSLDDLREALAAQEFGIEVDFEMAEMMIEAVLEDGRPGLVSVAQALPPEDGEDGRLDYLHETGQAAGKTRQDGTMDYYQRSLVINVEQGEVIGDRVAPTPGMAGMDIWGKEIPVIAGRPADVSGLHNIILSKDGKHLEALIDGCLVFDEGQPGVHDPLVIEGDVHFKTGHIHAETAAIEVEGSVADRFEVRSSADIWIKKDVEDGMIETRANITIGGGVLMKENGSIVAGGKIHCTHAQNARMTAGGSIEVTNSVVNSELESGEKILLPDAQLMGGIAKARLGMVVKTLGAESHLETEVVLGITYGDLEQIAVARTLFQEELERITGLIGEDPDMERFLVLPEDEMSTFKEVLNWRDRNQRNMQKLDEVQDQLLELNRQRRQASVLILGSVYPGVRVNILGRVYEVTQRVSQCAIEYDCESGQVVLRPTVRTSSQADAAGVLEEPVSETILQMSEPVSEFSLEELLNRAGSFWTEMKRQKFTVLVVDDDHPTRQLLRKILEAEGYRVIQDAGRTALDKLRTNKIQMVLLDISLQGFDGIQILQQIKSDRLLGSIPVVMLSARTDKDTIMRVKRHRADDYIVKPFDRETILNKVKLMKALNVRRVTEVRTKGKRVQNPDILIVDDDRAIRRILSRILQSLGATVTQAANAREAIAALRDQQFHMIFLDISMPQIDGLTLCSKIRQIDSLKKVPIIMCSARKEKESIIAAREAGANDYVVKPFNQLTIEEKLSKHLPMIGGEVGSAG